MNSKRLNEKIHQTVRKLLKEYKQANKNENGKLYNFKKYHVSVEHDHNPPHFHVFTSDGCNLKFRIDNGELICDENPKGGKSTDKAKIISTSKKWLDAASSKYPKLTNREYCIQLWKDSNPEKDYETGYNGY